MGLYIPKIDDSKSHAVYLYGSRVYGTFNSDSDWDFISIVDESGTGELDSGYVNIKLMSKDHFQKLLNDHNISALECYFLTDRYVVKAPDFSWDFSLDLQKLRHSISQKSNHSWVKAKKKLLEPYDWAVDERKRGKKSLFHSFRILMFGIQIAKEGGIYDYSQANHIFEDIVTEPNDSWDTYYDKWKVKHNELFSKFRELAPKF